MRSWSAGKYSFSYGWKNETSADSEGTEEILQGWSSVVQELGLKSKQGPVETVSLENRGTGSGGPEPSRVGLNRIS